MRSCIFVFYIAIPSCSSERPSAAARRPARRCAPQDRRPDALYAQRDDLASARRGRSDLGTSGSPTHPQDFEAAWKLARARYWLGGHAAGGGAQALLERGIAAARAAVDAAAEPARRPLLDRRQHGGARRVVRDASGLRYRGAIKDALVTVLRLDPAFQDGSADRALGRWYFKVPGLFGGSKKKSEEHLRQSLTYDPNSTASHFFLAETLFEMGRDAEARAELQKVIDAPVDPDWGPEDREFKAKAQARLRASSNPKLQAPNPNQSQLPISITPAT